MLDVSDEMRCHSKVTMWKKDITNVSASSQCFSFIWTKIQIKQNIRVVVIVLSSVTYIKVW